MPLDTRSLTHTKKWPNAGSENMWFSSDQIGQTGHKAANTRSFKKRHFWEGNKELKLVIHGQLLDLIDWNNEEDGVTIW